MKARGDHGYLWPLRIRGDYDDIGSLKTHGDLSSLRTLERFFKNINNHCRPWPITFMCKKVSRDYTICLIDLHMIIKLHS